MPNPICSIDGCETSALARDLCSKHYQRWRKYGDPLVSRCEYFSTFEEAFDAQKEWDGDCLVWTGSKISTGYGKISVNGLRKLAHRYSWERENGPIPSGMVVNHVCWNRKCVNIEHLELATQAENSSYRSGADPRNQSSRMRNVHRNKAKGKWVVQVKKDGVNHNFGYYSSVEEAAEVAERARRRLFGHFAGNG